MVSTRSRAWQPTFPTPGIRGPMVFVLRTSTEPSALTPLLQAAVDAIDKDQPVSNVRTMNEVVSALLAPRRVRMLLIGVFAALALILFCVGIYGVMAAFG